MIRLYDTKDTLKKLSLLTKALNIECSKMGSVAHQGNKNIDKIKNITSIVEKDVFCGKHCSIEDHVTWTIDIMNHHSGS